MCRSRSCIISALETFSGVGLHALLTGAPGAAASEPLAVKPLAAVGPSQIPFHEWLFNTTKTLVKYCLDAGLWIFVVSKAVVGHFSTTHSDRIFTYLYGKTLYIYVLGIRRMYTPAKIHIRCIRIRVRRKFIYTYTYVWYVYIRRIFTYTVWANPTYMAYLVGSGQP